MSKDLTFNSEARDRVLAGVEKLAKTVAVTMGPMGKNVIIGKFVGNPTITKDGVSVAREVELKDPIEDLGCQLVKEVAGRTADIAGDGTTTATVLTHEIFKKGNSLIDKGYSPLLFRDAVNWTMHRLLENLNTISRDVGSFEDIKNIATISANNDIELGQKIAEAFDAAGESGTVLAEAYPGLETKVRMIDGIELKSGYITSALLTKDGETDIVLENCRVLILDREMTQISDCLGLLNELSDQNIPLLIIAKSVEKEALSTLVANAKVGRIRVAAIKTPNFGLDQHAWIEDLSILLGTKVFGGSTGLSISSASIHDLGLAKRVSVGKYSTKIAGGEKDSVRLEEKLSFYEEDRKVLLGDNERRDISNRMAFLNSKAAMLSVGYSTEVELRQKGDRIEDALNATRAAIEEGIVPGGGIALIRAADMVDAEEADESWTPAVEVLLEACKRPLMQILENAHKDFDKIYDKIIKSKNVNYGYNAARDKFCDMIKDGVIDPKKVTRTALENSVSVAMLLINTEAVVSQTPDNPSGWQPPAGYRHAESGKLNHKW